MDFYKNMNSGFYNDLDENFNEAYKMSEREFSHEELILMLENGNIPQKQIAALKFDYIKSEKDAEMLLSNLIGCDGKIREAVALAINRVLLNDCSAKSFFNSDSAQVFAKSSIDINANICRISIDNAVLLKSNEDFSRIYTKNIVEYIDEAFCELDKFIFRDKKYVINKQVFKLYWSLEALKVFLEYVDSDKLTQLLEKSIEQKEYTIREKAAQILIVCNKFPDLYKKLQNDENYYVREVFLKQ